MRIQTHHIKYQDKDGEDWTVELPWFLHRPLNILQRWKPTVERYVLLTNFVHAVQYEWSKMRKELDRDSEADQK